MTAKPDVKPDLDFVPIAKRIREGVGLQGFMAHIGAEISELARGTCTLAVDRRPELLQQHGFFHGGVKLDDLVEFILWRNLATKYGVDVTDAKLDEFLRHACHGFVWGYDADVGGDLVKLNVSRLRRKLGAQSPLSSCRSLFDFLVSLRCALGQRLAIFRPYFGIRCTGGPATVRIHGLVGFRRDMRPMAPTERSTAPRPQRSTDGPILEPGWPHRDRPHG